MSLTAKAQSLKKILVSSLRAFVVENFLCRLFR